MNIVVTVDITIHVCPIDQADTPHHYPDAPERQHFDNGRRDTRYPKIHRSLPCNAPGAVGIEGEFADLEEFLERRRPMINSQQRKLIHLAKRRINLSDADYRSLLMRIAGVSTSNDLDDASFSAVMAELGRLGFQTVQQAPQFGERWGWATEKQLNYIRSLWRKYAGTEDETGMERFLEKKFKVSSLRFLDFETATKVIVTFEKMSGWRKTHPRKRAKPSAA